MHDLLDNELQKAKNNPYREVYLWRKESERRKKFVIVDIRTHVAEDDYLRNKFISDSYHVRVYFFDAKTKLLEGFQMYVRTMDEDVLILDVTDIEYNIETDDRVFALDFPENMIWAREPEILPDSERYEEPL